MNLRKPFLPAARSWRLAFLNAVGFAAAFLAGLAPAGQAATGTIRDVQHVVIFMQENRSFDHYFGTLKGVRGFSDPNAVLFQNGRSVLYQPRPRTYILPFHITDQCVPDVDHGWYSGHQAWNEGRWDKWFEAKGGITTMSHFQRSDIAYYHALADAYTICDAYHCSVMGPTNPNRLYLWTGMIDPNGTGGGPVIDNSEPGFSWTTYPERLENAGVSWKVYQETDNFDDNALAWFNQYRNAAPGTPLYDRGVSFVNDLVAAFKHDVTNGTLPSVSWLIAPRGLSEHAGGSNPNSGEYLTGRLLDALASEPAVYNSTVFLLMYDEDGGWYDHVPPPVPPPGTPDEFAYGQAIGLGVRVPMIVVSPWSRGGFVCSQVFDHTSILRFLENWTGVIEPNISAWRRAVCGDLTSAFDFANPDFSYPILPQATPLDCGIRVPPVLSTVVVPTQEPGTSPARPLPYQPDAISYADCAGGQLCIVMTNSGTESVHFAIYPNAFRTDPPWQYDVAPRSSVADCFDAVNFGGGRYDFTCYGPNGFQRRFAGNITNACNQVEVTSSINLKAGGLILALRNSGAAPVTFTITVNAHLTGGPWTYTVAAGNTVLETFPVSSNGWYDLSARVDSDVSFLRRLAGRIEGLSSGPMTFLTQPQSGTRYVGEDYIFTAAVQGTAPWSCQWLKNGSPLPGETNAELMLTALTTNDAANYSVIVRNVFGPTDSAVAVLTVLDQAPVISIQPQDHTVYPGQDVTFSVSAAGSLPLSYQWEYEATPISGATGTHLALSGANTNQSGHYRVTVTNARGSVTSSNALLTFTAASFCPGFLQFEAFHNIAGNRVADLTSHSSFPNYPTERRFMTSFDTRTVYPDDGHENYGARISGFFIPPVSGNWIFYLRSDDASRLFLNPHGSEIAGKQLIAEEPFCCNPFSAHASAPQPLVAGQSYYIEALCKEGTGIDYCQVAASLETDPTHPDLLPPISGTFLASFANVSGAQIQITQQPADQVFIVAPYVEDLLSENFDSSDGGFIVQTPLAYDGPWRYDAGRGGWVEDGQGPENGHPNSSVLTSPALMVTETGTVELTFVHRYSFEYGWDGGQVRISVNGGPFTPVPDEAFLQNGYGGNSLYSFTSAILAGQPAFIAESPNYFFDFITSLASLGNFTSGDVIRVQFVAASDSNSRGQIPNWQIDSVRIKQVKRVTFSVAASAVLPGEFNPPVFHQWHRDDGAGFVALPGENGPTYSFLPTLADNGARFRCTLCIPGASETSREALLRVRLPNRPPVANAGPDQTVECGGAQTDVSLDGRGSSDPDLDALTFAWSEGTTLLGTGETLQTSLSSGVHTVTLVVTDACGATSSDELEVRVVDTTAPSVTCPANIAVEFSSEAGSVVPFTVAAADACDPAVVATCAPPSGSMFPIGTTVVHCRASDGSGHTNHCAFTVTVLGSRGVIENVLGDLTALRATVADDHDGKKLDEAIEHLRSSLEPELWCDQTHLDRKHGDKVFHEAKKTVKKLCELIKDKESGIPDAVLQGFIDRIVKGVRLLATIAIEEAIQGGVASKKVEEARKELAKGDREVEDGKCDDGIEHYGHAWKHASHTKIYLPARMANGRLQFEVLGEPGERFTIQTSTNLTDWVTIATRAADFHGVLVFEDPDAMSSPVRYYRAMSP